MPDEVGTMSRAEELLEHLEDIDSLAIVCHDNPDPDTLASALALRRIAALSGLGSTPLLYGGEITHQQNRVFVSLLGLDPIKFEDDHLARYDHFALVDSASPGQNNPLPADTDVRIVVDHHHTEPADAAFVDQRPDFCSTTAIFVEYLRDIGIQIHQELATAMLFAVRRDTDGFLRNTTANAYEAAGYLHEIGDMGLLREMANPPVSEVTLDALGQAIHTRTVRSAYLIANVGIITERDAVPQATDYLLNLEGIQTVLVYGINGNVIHVSARSKDPRIQLGKLLDELFGDVGSAGGHDNMAGAQIPLGLFGDESRDADDLLELAGNIIESRFFRSAGYDNGPGDVTQDYVRAGAPTER